ncbi:carbohydrate deacetylase [Kaistella jeonii]|uniref:ChbG/HpnK family deacetylase n=1 Tax=Kaistella jeonii TaxID=266749 RepID=A0A0C1CZS8_9FLAO|nr:ChbG/HpnK family deacetylase [Kaistella jeonii]KIA89936.1 hypothetical protein OA86_04860 [Kaistella jeonii]SFB80690.1 Predicted glycoside hydrolase or deacetylase ChbG, UPF0249 family [Kaistella jeonii]VEI96191.1 Uncharacterized protein conserved in bacteria [Kaistella jeonii]
MVKNIILNADDLGFSLGVNNAILQAHTMGFLSHASLMANTEYFDHAVEKILPVCKDLKIGVHLNLTCGTALFSKNILAENRKLNNTFVSLLFKRKSKKTLHSIEFELEQQIIKIKEKGIEISHIDGHEHIHIIPSINKIVRKLGKKYRIERVREINESFFESWRFNGRTASLANFTKLLLLKFLSILNKNDKQIGFYSMLNTCEINAENLFPFLKQSCSYNTVEVMVHPALAEFDSAAYYETLNPRFVEFFKNPHRKFEFDLCFDKNFTDYKIL